MDEESVEREIARELAEHCSPDERRKKADGYERKANALGRVVGPASLTRQPEAHRQADILRHSAASERAIAAWIEARIEAPVPPRAA